MKACGSYVMGTIGCKGKLVPTLLAFQPIATLPSQRERGGYRQHAAFTRAVSDSLRDSLNKPRRMQIHNVMSARNHIYVIDSNVHHRYPIVVGRVRINDVHVYLMQPAGLKKTQLEARSVLACLKRSTCGTGEHSLVTCAN
jgi:hypothetical protein